MKKEKVKRSLAAAILTLFVASVAFVGCKKDKDENKPVVPPMIEQSHTISGNVVDKSGVDLKDVKVELKFAGKSVGTVATDSKGEFKFTSIKEAGSYLIEVSKTNYHTTNANLVIKDESKASVMLFVPITMVDEGVKQAISNTTGGTIELGEKTGSTPNVEFSVPANTMSKDETVTITPINDIVNTSSVKSELPLLTLSCAPAGLQFSAPYSEVVIPNPLGEFTISNLKLMYHDGSKWSTEAQGITVRDGKYVATIKHFSTYQVAFDTESGTPIASTEVISDIKGVDNFDGKQEIKVETLPYTFKSGYEYVITVDQALSTAGITGADAVKIKSILEESVKSKNNGMNAGYKTNNGQQVINQTIPVGVRLDASGVQNFSTVKYTISFEKNGTKYPVTVSVKIAGSVSITTQTYNKEHQGGNAGA